MDTEKRIGTKIGYMRVSTHDQDPALQRQALEKEGCVRIFEDHGVSGSKTDRPKLNETLAYLREGETLVVWKLDRLGRSLSHLIEVVTGLAARKIGFKSLTEGFDTTTNGGRLVFHIMGALAQFERELIGERTKAGLEAAKVKGGRRPVLTTDKIRKAQNLLDKTDLNVMEIARRVKVSRATIYNALNDGTLHRKKSAEITTKHDVVVL